MAKEIIKYTTSTKLIDATNKLKSLSKMDKEKSRRFFGLIFSRINKGTKTIFSYNELSQKYFRDSKYGDYKFLQILKVADIIETRLNEDGGETYSPDHKYSKSYRINPIYLNDNFITETFKVKKDYVTDAMEHNEFIYNESIKNLNSLVYNYSKLQLAKEKQLNKIKNSKITKITVDSDEVCRIHFGYIKNKNKYYYYSIKDVVKKTNKSSKDLIKYKNDYFIVDYSDFIAKKIETIKLINNCNIEKLISNNFTASRNDTNNRLDSNITNLPGYLMDEIIEDNDLVELDLKNAQFAFLGHIVGGINSSAIDIVKFKKMVAEGNFYEYIMSEFGVENRNDAKDCMFEVMFSKNKTKNKKNLKGNFKKFNDIFPTIYDIIYDMKKDNYKNLSIMLQKFESDLFVDKILVRLFKVNYYALSKHDSIICKRKDADDIKEIMMEEINKIGLGATINLKQN